MKVAYHNFPAGIWWRVTYFGGGTDGSFDGDIGEGVVGAVGEGKKGK